MQLDKSRLESHLSKIIFSLSSINYDNIFISFKQQQKISNIYTNV